MSKYRDTDYLYASGRIRALEPSLLDAAAAERLIDARSDDDVLKQLAACGYGAADVDMESPRYYEELIAINRAGTYEMVRQMAGNAQVLGMFMYQYDYHNIKVAMRQTILGADYRYLFMDGGHFEKRTFFESYAEETYRGFTQNMLDGVKRAKEVYAETQDAQLMDMALDAFCYADMQQAARDTGSEYLAGYVQALTDTVNLRTLLRLRAAGRDSAFARRALIPGGRVSADSILGAYEGSPEALLEFYRATPYGDLCERALSAARQPGGMGEIERMCDMFMLGYVAEAAYIGFGVEPLAAYIVRKENEYKSIKIIMAGRMSGLSGDDIRARLRY